MPFDGNKVLDPVEYRRRPRVLQSFSLEFLEDIVNPVDIEIRDAKVYEKAFHGQRGLFIPYAATDSFSCDRLLNYFNSARFISPTQGACHESIKTFALGKFDVSIAGDEDFHFANMLDEGEEELILTNNQKRLYGEFLKEKINLGDEIGFVPLGENMFDSYKENGNIFLETVLDDTLGVRSGGIHYHATENVKFATKTFQGSKMVGISPIWTEQYIKKNPPKMIPLYPNFTRDADGTLRTIIHVKNGKFKWYGRPDWVGAWLYVYREYQDVTYLLKQARKQWMAKALVELEEGDYENDDPWDEEGAVQGGFRGSGDQWNRNHTSQTKNPNPLWQTSRPPGARSAFVHEFKPDLGQDFFDKMDKINRRKIIEANQWSERLLGAATAEGFNKDAFISELKIKDISVLPKYRDAIEMALNIAINQIVKWTGFTEFEGYTLNYHSSIQDMKSGDSQSRKEFFTQLGVAIRSGAFTATEADERQIREVLEMPGDDFVSESWRDDKGYRRPVTLKTQSELEAAGQPID